MKDIVQGISSARIAITHAVLHRPRPTMSANLSIAAAPTTIEEAVNVAAEHFAFCPDNIWQGHTPNLTAYAGRLLDSPLWSFWWD